MAIPEQWQVRSALRGLVTFLWEADEHTSYYSGFDFCGLQVKKKLGHWLLIVKVHDGRRPLVSFTKSNTYWGAFFAFGWNVHYAEVQWVVDKWP